MSSMAERVVDGDQTFALSDLFAKIRVRKWAFALCVVIPTVLALTMTAMTPVTWLARTKILIRYGQSESVFLKGLIPEGRVALSGPASSEIIRSLPTIQETVERLGIEESDLYRSPRNIILGKVATWGRRLVGMDTPQTHEQRIASVAGTFQDSLETSSSSRGSAATSLELLAKDSNVATSQQGDELITLNVRAFNRERVADLTNGLAATFIDQYQRISAEDARRSVKFLSVLVDRYTAEIRKAEQDPSGLSILPERPATEAESAGVQDGSLSNQLAQQLGTREAALARDQQLYREGTPQIRAARAGVARLRQLYNQQQRLDAARALLDRVKMRRLEAINTENLYRNQLVPISVVERAVTPAPSASKKIVRLLIAAISGLLVGSVFGLSLVIVLSLLDERFYTAKDLERSLDVPLLGAVPRLAIESTSDPKSWDASSAATASVSQILAHLVGKRSGGGAHVIAVASSADGDGKSLIAVQLARTLASSGRSRVLIIDADPGSAGTSLAFGLQSAPGLLDGIEKADALTSLVVAGGSVAPDVLPIGAAPGSASSFFLPQLRELIAELRERYDVILIDTPSDEGIGRSVAVAIAADEVVVVARQGFTRRSDLHALVRKLRDLALPVRGAIFNFDVSRPSPATVL